MSDKELAARAGTGVSIQGNGMDIEQYWDAVLRQDAEAMANFFHEDAWVNWHNTNEHFTAAEFIRANCEYPGAWDGRIEHVLYAEACIITAVHVYSKDGGISCHVTSFLSVRDGKIASVEEYWGDDGEAPQWRKEKHIGTKIHQ